MVQRVLHVDNKSVPSLQATLNFEALPEEKKTTITLI